MSTSGTTTQRDQPDSTERSTDMNHLAEGLAREHRNARLSEAQQLRRGHQLTRARRLSRKAERAAAQARLALARAL